MRSAAIRAQGPIWRTLSFQVKKVTSMSKKEVLFELIDDNTRRVHRLLSEPDDTFLYWSADGEANTIAVTIWHVTRAHDVFLTQHILGEPADNEIWFRSGWMEDAGLEIHVGPSVS
jgi:hypothetical protein